MADTPAAPVAAVEAEIAAVEEELETVQPGSAEWRELTIEIKGLRADLRELLTQRQSPEPAPAPSPTPAPATPEPTPEPEPEAPAVLHVAQPGGSSPEPEPGGASNPPKASRKPRKRRLKLW